MIKKLLPKKKEAKPRLPSRITNETVAEHRETILAGGRRFKYPLQYARHKLVINALIIVVVTAVAMSTLVWWQLYIVQNSGDLMYRVTKVAPLPIGSVDGEPIRYSDYLLNYRPSEHYLNNFDEIQPGSEDGQLQLQYKKREAMDLAISDAYARKLAKQLGLSVTEDELMAEIDASRVAENGEQSIEAYEASVMRILGTDREGTRSLIRNSLLRTKVAFEVDEEAAKAIKEIADVVEANDGDFTKASNSLEEKYGGMMSTGNSGRISHSTSFGGIRASSLAQLDRGEVSSILKSVTEDGYYIVKLDEKTDNQISFSYIHIPLTKFRTDLATLKEENKIREYIDIKIDQPEAIEEEGGE